MGQPDRQFLDRAHVVDFVVIPSELQNSRRSAFDWTNEESDIKGNGNQSRVEFRTILS